MNILFTNYCNLKCDYCFAKGTLGGSEYTKKSYISLDNLKIALNFLKNSKQTRVGVIGGEPTLHPEFEKAFKTILDKGHEILLYSNGMIRKSVLAYLSKIKKEKWGMLLNVNIPQSYSKKEWSIINETMDTLSDKIGLGHTICRPDFRGDFIIKLIKKYRLIKCVRLGMAAPICGHKNLYLSFNGHKKAASRVVKFAQKCNLLDIYISFDCGFLLCSFTEKEIGRLFYYNVPLTCTCTPVIDVGPDLMIWRCFATSMIWQKNLKDFKNLEEIYSFYVNKFKPFKKSGILKKCFRCKYLQRGQCVGGCLGHTLKSFNVEKTNLLRRPDFS
ncbi:MAG: radical SAM protein [Candidatus Omnitrophota bacterium]